MEFDRVYQEYFQDVFYYLRSLSADRDTAEELTQEAFTKALGALDRFDGQKDIRAWLFTIAKNTYIDYCRRKKHLSGEELDEALADSGPQFTECLMDRDTAFRIHKFLQEMPEPYKEVFSLRVFGELPFEQIAQLFGKSPSWARVTFYRAKQKILKCLEESEYESPSL